MDRPGKTQDHCRAARISCRWTNTDVFYAYSDDHGLTWHGGDQGGVSCVGRLIANVGAQTDDQWFPWAAANPNDGSLSVGYMDEFFDGPENYGFTINTSTPLVLGTPPVFAPAP